MLDDRVQIAAEGAGGLQHGLHRGLTLRRLDHHTTAHRLGEGQILCLHLRNDLRIDLLEMQVTDPVGILTDQLEVVAAVVRDVPGVEAEVHIRRVRRLDEALDVGLVAHVAVGVRVELHVETVLVEDAATELIHSGRQPLPLLHAQLAALQRCTGLVVAPWVGNHHDVFAAHGLCQSGDVGDLPPHVIPRVGPVQMLEDCAR